MSKSRTPSSLAGFVAVPVVLQSKALGKDVKHYIYIKAYEPKTSDEESPRALFVVNIPVTATEAQLRHLLTTQIGGAHVQSVYFAGPDGASSTSSSSALIATTKGTAKEPPKTLGKRKRPAQESAEDISARLSTFSLPSTKSSAFHATGSSAIAIFLDRPSRDLTLRACQKFVRFLASNKIKPITWSAGLETSKQPLLGLARYEAQRTLTYPPRADLLRAVDHFMTTYSTLEAAQARESAKRRAEPDEDGFVIVTRGSKGVVKSDEADAIKAKLEEKKRKEQGLEDFYRFQMRERRKADAGGLLRRFEHEREQVGEMSKRRGRWRNEG